jgi:RNA polymerase sigma factor (TIGR02999 family)
MTTPPPSAEDLVRRLGEGEPQAAADLLPLVYDDLRAAAGAMLRQERPGHTLQPTALVHEAFMRLAGSSEPAWTSRAHFRAIAAKVMRQILMDHARRRDAVKHGGDMRRVTLTGAAENEAGLGAGDVDVLDLHAALEKLATLSARQAQVVEMRIFGGLTVNEVAHVLGVGTTTVDDDWAIARAWLARELRPAR